ncbi:MAG: hypothetical protein LQ343_003372 [Gyalolechia ehrenbergii]|nr:MAG: hypothetical protein LQ343_003372 [Gyalolechia ehrenbergii]
MTVYRRIFEAVFPPPSEASQPTPKATPVLGSAGFEGFSEASFIIDWNTQDNATEQIQWERAWHIATTFLSLPSEGLPPTDSDDDLARLDGKWQKPCTREIKAAIKYLVSPESQGASIRRHQQEHSLLHWYFEEAGLRHFVQYVRPQILKRLEKGNFAQAISSLVTYLERAYAIYLHNLHFYVFPLCPGPSEEHKKSFMFKLTSLFTYSLPQQRINDILGEFIRQRAEVALEAQTTLSKTEQRDLGEHTRVVLWKLQENGLGDSRLQKILAEVMSDMLSKHIRRTYAGEWKSQSNVTTKLRYWVENRFARFIVEVMSILSATDARFKTRTEIMLSDVERWQEIAISRLGILRTEELFDVIVAWKKDSKGAVEDLKRYVTTTAARTHLTNSFSEVLGRRLLQPGAATTAILQIYISIIRAFAILDPKGVLLDRVARPIRRYLRDRDDTVAIVVSSLLADSKDPSPGPDVLSELADEMENSDDVSAQEDDDADLDFEDMEWMPDPVDAGPDYRNSKRLDVIGSLISLFETKDIFVKEFQQILGERLLRNEQNFEKEIRVLELLKVRFGEASLQACEVMLRDILDSRRVDTVIRNDQNLAMSTKGEPYAEVHARILSHLFWPSLHDESFSIPPEISAIQARYEKGFETLKQSRKLTWLNVLGQVTVHLEFEDRSITEVVQTWQASVIYAFQDDDPDGMTEDGQPVIKTVAQLISELSMSESYVRNGLTFWVGKLVLHPSSSSPDTYHVLETLPSSAQRTASGSATTLLTAAAAADAATSAPAPAVRSEEEIMKEKMEVFWQFVVGMLTNQGAMPLTRIVMMLKVVVPGGFPFGNEELKQFLEGRVREGRLEVVGGSYRIKT